MNCADERPLRPRLDRVYIRAVIDDESPTKVEYSLFHRSPRADFQKYDWLVSTETLH